ncbi:MAG: SDR family NAD(P)-dependent oxidoreductase [Streptosporangiaceae bacterium]
MHRHSLGVTKASAVPVENVTADVADEASVREVVDTAARRFGGVDILVNNAGIYPSLPLESLDSAEFDRVVAVNLRGVFLFTKYVSELMKAQGRGGHIINVTSIDALHPSMIGLAAYDATKHGVWGFMKNAALELAPYNIQVNAVAPGGITTPGVQTMNSGAAAGVDTEALTAAFLAAIPMRRMGEPDDIGKVVLFLVSDMASYMTGTQVVVDGGALLT